MQITRIYTPEKLSEGQQIILDKKASGHLLRVLRVRQNDPVVIFNGQGGEYQGKIVDIQRNQAFVELLQYIDVDRESPLKVHLAQGISRGERMDHVIQKATELGVASITPIFTERSTVKLSGDRLEKRLDHWKSIAISSCEQSGRCQIPSLFSAASFMDFVSQHGGEGYICDPESDTGVRQVAKQCMNITLLIGPEGGFSSDEINFAHQKGFLSLSLGPRILRTETAPIVAITLLQSQNGDI